MKRLLLALLLAAACKHSTSSSSTSHSETSTITDTKTSESGATTTTTTVTEQPGETTTTTEEFSPPPAEPQVAAADVHEASVRPAEPAAPGRVPRHGPLVKRTVSVAKYGIETTETRQVASTQGTAASETKAAGKVDTQAKAKDKGGPSAGCVGASWIWGLGILVFAVASILGILKFRKA